MPPSVGGQTVPPLVQARHEALTLTLTLTLILTLTLSLTLTRQNAEAVRARARGLLEARQLLQAH